MSGSSRPPEKKQSAIKELEVPYIPAKINLKVLKKRKGLLVEKNEIKKIREWVNENKDKVGDGIRLTRSQLASLGIKSGFNVVILPRGDDFQIASIFLGKKNAITAKGKDIEVDYTLGSGAFGKVKIGQDLETAKFVAVKIQQSVLPSARKKHLNEIGLMKELGVSTGGFVYEPTGKNKEIYTKPVIVGKDEKGDNIVDPQSRAMLYVMDLAPGLPLHKLAGKLTLEESNHVAAAMIDIVQSLHDRGILHLDIKLENFIYDKESRKLSLIDYGESLTFNMETNQAEGSFRGSPFYQAPELKHFYDTYNDKDEWAKPSEEIVRRENDVTYFRYSRETDIYSLGVALGDLYQLLEKPAYDGKGIMPPSCLANENSKLFINNKLIENENDRKSLLSFLASMAAPTREERSSLEKAASFFDAFTKKNEKEHARPNVGLLDLAEYEKIKMEQGSLCAEFYITNALKQFNEVILIWPGGEIEAGAEKQLLKLREEFVSNLEDDNIKVNVKVRHVLYGDSDPLKMATGSVDFDAGNILMPASNYFYVTTEKPDKNLETALSGKVKPINVKIEPFKMDDEALKQSKLDEIKKAVHFQMSGKAQVSGKALSAIGLFATGPKKGEPAPDHEKTPTPRND